MAIYTDATLTLAAGDRAQAVSGYAVSSSFRIALVRQALVESLVLGGVAAAAGTALAAWSTRALLAIVPADLPRAQMRPITPDYFRTLGIPIVRGRRASARAWPWRAGCGLDTAGPAL